MMNNPLILLIQAAQSGGNPMQIIGQMAGNNPIMAQGMRLVQGKSPDQLKQMAQNMARERGTTAEAVLQSLGLK